MIKVKLNNPLMGTEIQFHEGHPSFPLNYLVKLNNPLMGTEISFSFSNSISGVKLLNPPSGPVLISKTHMSTKI